MARFENCLQCGERLTGTTIFCVPCMACLCSWECRERHMKEHAAGLINSGQKPSNDLEQDASTDSRH